MLITLAVLLYRAFACKCSSLTGDLIKCMQEKRVPSTSGLLRCIFTHLVLILGVNRAKSFQLCGSDMTSKLAAWHTAKHALLYCFGWNNGGISLCHL